MALFQSCSQVNDYLHFILKFCEEILTLIRIPATNRTDKQLPIHTSYSSLNIQFIFHDCYSCVTHIIAKLTPDGKHCQWPYITPKVNRERLPSLLDYELPLTKHDAADLPLITGMHFPLGLRYLCLSNLKYYYYCCCCCCYSIFPRGQFATADHGERYSLWPQERIKLAM